MTKGRVYFYSLCHICGLATTDSVDYGSCAWARARRCRCFPEFWSINMKSAKERTKNPLRAIENFWTQVNIKATSKRMGVLFCRSSVT